MGWAAATPVPLRYYESKPLLPFLLNALRRCLRRGPFGAFNGCDEVVEVPNAATGCWPRLPVGWWKAGASFSVAGLSVEEVPGSCSSVSFNNALRLCA